MKTKIVATVLFLFMLHGFLNAGQTITSVGRGHITGKIRNDKNNLPIQDANIELFSATDSSLVAGTISDGLGFFTIFRLDTGKYYLVVNSPEFVKNELREFSINPSNNKIELGEIGLHSENPSPLARNKPRPGNHGFPANAILSNK